MNKIIKFNIDTLKKVLDLIRPIEEVWVIKNKDANSDTNWRHISHKIDFYIHTKICFLYLNNKMCPCTCDIRHEQYQILFYLAMCVLHNS